MLRDVQAREEHGAVRHDVGLVDRGDVGVLEVSGRDRAVFLHAMLSNDVKALAPGQGCRAALLDVHGKVQELLVVWALDERMLVLTPPGRAEKTLHELDTYLFSEKASFHDATGEHAFVLLAGPRTLATVQRLAGTVPPEKAWSHVAARLDGVDVRLARGAGETGEAEVWVESSAADGARVRAALGAAGARSVGATAWESLRIEAGTPAFGRDVDDGVLLPEIALGDFVSYTKGCYVGQEVVVRIRDRGHVNRHLCGLVISGAVVPEPGASVVAGDQDAGRITSAAWSFGLERPIALAFIRRQHAEPGTAVAVRAGAEILPATVSALPFER